MYFLALQERMGWANVGGVGFDSVEVIQTENFHFYFFKA